MLVGKPPGGGHVARGEALRKMAKYKAGPIIAIEVTDRTATAN